MSCIECSRFLWSFPPYRFDLAPVFSQLRYFLPSSPSISLSSLLPPATVCFPFALSSRVQFYRELPFHRENGLSRSMRINFISVDDCENRTSLFIVIAGKLGRVEIRETKDIRGEEEHESGDPKTWLRQQCFLPLSTSSSNS